MAKLPGAVQGARIVGERFVRSQRQHNPEGRMPLDDLNPRRFVQKHLLSDLNRDDPDATEASGKTPATASPAGGKSPFDTEAT
jgi:hypothetical protein